MCRGTKRPVQNAFFDNAVQTAGLQVVGFGVYTALGIGRVAWVPWTYGKSGVCGDDTGKVSRHAGTADERGVTVRACIEGHLANISRLTMGRQHLPNTQSSNRNFSLIIHNIPKSLGSTFFSKLVGA